MYSVTFTGYVFIIWHAQTTHAHMYPIVSFCLLLYGDLHDSTCNFYFLNKFLIAMWQFLVWCFSVCWDDGYTSRAAVWHRRVVMRAVVMLDILFLHRNASHCSGAVRAASGSKQCLSHTEKSLLLSSPRIACLSQHLDHNIHQATDVRITANSFPVSL